MRTATLTTALALFGTGCSSGGDTGTGAGEPLVIRAKTRKGTTLAQFIPGRLPGFVPTGTDTSTTTDTSTPKSLEVTLEYKESKVYQGQGSVPFTGFTSKDAFSVALALENLGSGYWVVPVGTLDAATQMMTWDALADFGPQIPSGMRNLQYVGIDGNGVAGELKNQPICMANRVPDGYQGCVPNPRTPAAVISLSWDTNVDLDLQVRAPDGRVIEPKSPATVDLDAGTTVLPDDAGRIDRDSNAGCAIDNIRYENLVWQKVAPKGRYGIYVNLFDACKQPTVRFNVQVYTAVDGTDAGTKVLQSWYSADGILLDFQANGGASAGLFVTEFDFQ